MSFPGLTVARSIPPEVIAGLLSGQYKQYGGVIRWASGTAKAGQIVRHLLPVANTSLSAALSPVVSALGVVNTLQLHGISNKVDQVAQLGAINSYQLRLLSGQVKDLNASVSQLLQIANGTMVLSGLNLAVSAVSFAIINQKLQSLENKLNEIQKEVKAIRSLLELEERAKLGAALRDLSTIGRVKNIQHRQTILLNAKNTLSPIQIKYQELLLNAESLETMLAYEEYFCLTSLAYVRCLAELEMLEMALQDMLQTYSFWKEQALHIVKEHLIADNPERFLFSDFAQKVPVAVLVEWLDFAYEEEKGYGWIDELRMKTRPWYAEDSYVDVGKGAAKVTSSLLNLAGQYLGRGVEKELERQHLQILPAFQKLVARNNVLSGYLEQYRLLESSNMTPTALEAQVQTLAESHSVDGYLILEPASESSKNDSKTTKSTVHQILTKRLF